MKNNKDKPEDAAGLRRRAEERLRRLRPAGVGQRTEIEAARLIHELEVHQIQLEMQHEELLQTRANMEALLAQYTDLYDFAPTGYLTFDCEGTIRKANLSGAHLLGVDRCRLLRRRFHLFVAEKDRRVFSDFLLRVFSSHVKESCEVTLLQGGADPLVAQIEGARSEDGLECRAIVVDLTERKRTEKRLQMFSQEILTAREEERKQVASVLHHDVGSLAVGLSAHLEAIQQDLYARKPGEALKWIKRTRKLLDMAVGRLKGVAVQLRPPELDAIGLRPAMRQYFLQVTKNGRIRIHFRETLGRRKVSGDTAITLFRVAQEALTNAIKHGHAKQVNVGLTASKGKVRLIVRDNGKGFNPSEQRARTTSQMGLRVMREMVASAQGVFTIDSSPEKGTSVCVSLPLDVVTLARRAVTARKEKLTKEKTPLQSTVQGSRPLKGAGA